MSPMTSGATQSTIDDVPDRAALCPRCDHDLRAELSRWIDSCPLHGRCVECGCAIEWSSVLRPAAHPWLFEFYWRERPGRRLVRTLFLAMRPLRFWREVQLTDQVNLRPVLFVLLLVVFAYLTTFAGWFVLEEFIFAQNRAWRNSYALEPWRLEYGDWILTGYRFALRATLSGGAALLVWLLAPPLVMTLLPVTLRRARVRPRHIARIWLYSLWAPLLIMTLWVVLAALSVHIEWPIIGAALRFIYFWNRGFELSLLSHTFDCALVTAAVLAPWIVVWWAVAVSRYVRIESWKPTIVAMTIILALTSVLAQVIVFFIGWDPMRV